MKRHLKIKVSIVFLAWSVLFMHGVIPHLHMQEHHGPCNSIFHNINAGETPAGSSAEQCRNQSDQEKVCHFTDLLFQQLGTDELLIIPSFKYVNTPAVILKTVFVPASEGSITHTECSSVLLRAPPLS